MVRGDVFQVNLDPSIGSEIRKARPAVIVSNDIGNAHAATVIICPITEAKSKPSPIHIFVTKGEGGLTKDSVIHCGQIRTVDKTRLGERLGRLSETTMEKVNKGLSISLSISV